MAYTFKRGEPPARLWRVGSKAVCQAQRQFQYGKFFFTRGDLSLEDLAQDDAPAANTVGPNVLNSWIHSDLLTVKMLGMAHAEFSSMFQRRESAQRFARNQVADYEREDANTSYAWVNQYTLKFLDAILKHDASAKAFLENTPAENRVPKHFLGIPFRPAQEVVSSEP